MTKHATIVALMLLTMRACLGQLGGGAATYGQDRSDGSALSEERAKRIVTKDHLPPGTSSVYLDASVLLNRKADEFVATFAVNQEGVTLDEAREKMNATIQRFTAEVKKLGVGPGDLYVDFVAQNRIYGFEVEADVAKEKIVGFEVKKNVSVRYKSDPMLDKLLEVASKEGIFDLVKVDYIVNDLAAVRKKLMEHASRVIKGKAANHLSMLGVKLQHPPQICAERYSSYYPTDMYDSYVAQESETVSASYIRQRFTIQGARKPRTFYFDGLSAKLFDHVENPALVEPVVQFSLYLKVKAGMGKGPAESSQHSGGTTNRRAGPGTSVKRR